MLRLSQDKLSWSTSDLRTTFHGNRVLHSCCRCCVGCL